jgi:hypothetical protein
MLLPVAPPARVRSIGWDPVLVIGRWPEVPGSASFLLCSGVLKDPTFLGSLVGTGGLDDGRGIVAARGVVGIVRCDDP